MTLAAKFQEMRTNCIDVDGHDVFSLYEVDLNGVEVIHVETIEFDVGVEQGVRFKVAKGEFLINGQQMKEAVVWMGTAPPKFDIQIKPSARNGVLKVWNCWKIDGVVQAWTGNAGMLVDVADDRISLNFSPGQGDFAPSSMKLVLTLQRAS